MKTFEIAPPEVAARANALIQKYHTDLDCAGVRIDYVFAHDEDGDPVSHHGYPAVAVVRVVNLKDRTKGLADAEITIDAKIYAAMKPEQQDGLLDHELYHLIVPRDDEGEFKQDATGRPRLKLRKHDWQMGWFTEIAKRHGPNSPEVFQAQILWDKAGQAFFPMLLGEAPPATKKLKILKPATE